MWCCHFLVTSHSILKLLNGAMNRSLFKKFFGTPPIDPSLYLKFPVWSLWYLDYFCNWTNDQIDFLLSQKLFWTILNTF